jgi:exodeoxyribonuclease VII large subunit
MNEILSISELCNVIKKMLPNKKFQISGNVSQPKISQGHLYLTLKDSNSLIKCIIWKSLVEKINNITDGDKITVRGKLDYYSYGGQINFVIDEIIENEGLGELQIKYNLIKTEFESKGYFDNKNKLLVNNIINKILIITSENGAAIHDFLFNLNNNKSKIMYDIVDVPVQGTECPKLICSKLKEIYNDENLHYDLIVITRGGGSFQDLFGFSEAQLIKTVYKYKKFPILSAIGHQVDNPLLDLIADISSPTPSLASQWIIDHNNNYINTLINEKNKIKDEIIKSILANQKNINESKNKVKILFNELVNIISNYKNQLVLEIMRSKEKLNSISKTIDFNSKEINLFDMNNNKIKDPVELVNDDLLYLQWNNKRFKIQIISDE